MENGFVTKYGLKIRNLEAGVLDEYNRGLRPYLSYSKATFPNSLLCDYLLEHGLQIRGGSSTRQLIGISFSFGCGSFDSQLKKLENKLLNAKDSEERDFYKGLIDQAKENENLYEEKNKLDLRTQFYSEGVTINYPDESIHYVPLYRSSGRAKLGACTFIDDRLYDDAIDFLRMGMKFEEDEELDIVSLQAYSALAASSIKDRIYIDPDDVLVIKDVDSVFRTNVISIETDEERHCYTKRIDDYPLKNTLFDGQSLIDDSLWDDHFEGYVLLRNLFFKSACFHTNLQLFFKDYFGEEYENAVLKDMWGREIPVKRIKLITTENSIKWVKFPVDYEYWANQIREKTKGYWGVVKSAYFSKFGDVQRMSYQMINALDLSSIDSVIKYSKDYIYRLKTDDEAFIQYLKDNVSFANDFDVLVALYEHNPEFSRSSYFRERRSDIIYNYSLEFKNGRCLNNADNLVIVGSPYAMLLAAVGEDCLALDDTFSPEEGCIQVSTKRFDDDTYLASFRSPFNSQNNLCCLHNVYNDKIDRYFPFGKQIIAVNLIGTDFQARNNGSDQDSDSIYVTDQSAIVYCAQKCVKEFPTIENNIPKETNHYINNPENFALVDHKIASANMAIGESSNLAQLCLTYGFNFPDEKYRNYACILAVLAQVAIDNAKRTFAIDINGEIRRVKKDLNVKENGLPLFWFYIKRKGKFAKGNKGKRQYMENHNPSLICPMNYICEVVFPQSKPSLRTISDLKFLIKKDLNKTNRRTSRKVESLIEKYSIDLFDERLEEGVEYPALEIEFDELIRDIRRVYLNNNYQNLMLWLIKRAFQAPSVSHKANNSLTKKNRPILMKTLYKLNPEVFLSCFKDYKVE